MTDFPFAHLDPQAILGAVEQATGQRLLNVCRPHASYINRVYELQREDGEFLVAKFYRPGRWSRAGLEDELHFVAECAAAELPVICPLQLEDGGYLGTSGAIHFAVYPRLGGRLVDEYSDEQWLELGRLLGRLHTVGKGADAPHRNRLHPRHTTRAQIDYLVARDLIPASLSGDFKAVSAQLLSLIEPLFNSAEMIRLHGDCHSSNLIHRPGESFFIIDFDDMVVGPPVQDLWMLLPGYLEDSRVELALLIEGYETFRPFDRSMLALIEPLRAMRFIHYISWCAHQFVEDGFTRVIEDFGSHAYWRKEIIDLEDQVAVIRESLGNRS
ncbi:MAG: serine/threonine protein kinase [Desulfofustis sp.]|jgi:Ser/Thr protein kinase RdoA (MazF antagonist)|nr:serine/threonine protein kinase [Desulfofustis sp.]